MNKAGDACLDGACVSVGETGDPKVSKKEDNYMLC